MCADEAGQRRKRINWILEESGRNSLIRTICTGTSLTLSVMVGMLSSSFPWQEESDYSFLSLTDIKASLLSVALHFCRLRKFGTFSRSRMYYLLTGFICHLPASGSFHADQTRIDEILYFLVLQHKLENAVNFGVFVSHLCTNME